MRKEEKRRQMFSIVEQWQASGMSQVAFAKVNNIKPFTLRYWINKFRQQQNETSGFIRLNEPTMADLCIRYPNGVELLLPVHAPISLIKGLVNI